MMEDVKNAAQAMNDRSAGLEFEVSVSEDVDDVQEGLISSKSKGKSSFLGTGGQEGDDAPKRPMGLCGCFTLAFYQPYFDVDTTDVQQRLGRALVPFRKNPTFAEIAQAKPDAYGPFWLSTTLIFALASCSNAASFLDYAGQKENWSYDFSRLASACTLVEVFLIGIPVLIWGVARYLNVSLSFSFLVCLYGYSTTVYVPASLICIIPADALDWVLLLLCMAWSLFFILTNLWPIVSTQLSNDKVFPLVAFISAVHLAWSMLIKLLFF